MTFLELVQQVARESGTVQGINQPSSVATALVGRQSECVSWVREAWVQIQNKQRTWRFMQGEFEHALTIGQGRYPLVPPFAPARFREPITHVQTSLGFEQAWSVYGFDLGLQSDRGPVIWEDWGDFYIRHTRTDIEANRPMYFSIAPDGQMAVAPAPDQAYVLKGLYRKSAQILQNDADVPDLPIDHHSLIVWWALAYLGIFDETAQLPQWRYEAQGRLRALELDQLPRVRMAPADIY